MRVIVAFVAALVLSACSGNSPTGPTPQPAPNPAPAPTPAPLPSFQGTVTATNGKQPLSGVTVTAGGLSTVTDASGGFRLAVVPGVNVALSGPGLVPRSTRLGSALEMFGPGFDLGFYRQFARNGFEQPQALQPIRHWTQAPRIYLSTVRGDGVPIDGFTLDRVEETLINTAAIWSGGIFGLAGLERGTGSKVGVPGWITVLWPPLDDPLIIGNVCGRADIGLDGGRILFAYRKVGTATAGSCECGSAKASLGTIRHELGHAFGFYHTDHPQDVMSTLPKSPGAWCDSQPSAREREYARYVYSRPIGNRDPDSD